VSAAKRCDCGNALGEPRVNPFPVSFVPVGMKDPVAIAYNAGFDQHGRCWFCAFPRAAS